MKLYVTYSRLDLKRFKIFKNIPSNCRPRFSDIFSKISAILLSTDRDIKCIVCVCVSFLYICLTSETLHYPWVPSYEFKWYVYRLQNLSGSTMETLFVVQCKIAPCRDGKKLGRSFCISCHLDVSGCSYRPTRQLRAVPLMSGSPTLNTATKNKKNGTNL